MKKFLLGIFLTFSVCIGTFFTTHNTYANENRLAVENSRGLQQFQLGNGNGSGLPSEIIQIPVDTKPQSALLIFLSFAQAILLKLVLPVVAVGCGLYIAYELFTAEGDESKLKNAWMAIVYSIVAIVSIVLSAFIVSLISRLSIG